MIHRPRVLCLPTGPEEYAAAIARAVQIEADVHLMAPVPFVDRYADDFPADMHLHPVHWPRHRDPRSARLVGRVISLVRMIAPDIVHFLGDSVVWLALALPALRRLPMVVTVHDVTYHPGDTQSSRVPMSLVELLRRRADAIIVHGPSLQADLARSGMAPRAGVHVIPHLVLNRHVRLANQEGIRRQADQHGPRIVFFGRIMAYKGLGLLIAAADLVILRHPNARFIIAGIGPDLDRWRPALAARPWFELRDRFIQDPELAQLLLDADLIALPYLEASQSGVAAMAAGFGLPVVTTDVGELGTITNATGMGITVAPNPADFAQALIAMLSDDAKRAAFAAASAAAAVNELSEARVARDTVSLYNRLIAIPSQVRRSQLGRTELLPDATPHRFTEDAERADG